MRDDAARPRSPTLPGRSDGTVVPPRPIQTHIASVFVETGETVEVDYPKPHEYTVT